MSELDRLAAVLAGALEKRPGAHKYALEIVLEAMRDPSPEVAATLVPREADPRPALCVWEGMLDALLAEDDAIDPGDHCRAPMICTDNHVDDTIDGDGPILTIDHNAYTGLRISRHKDTKAAFIANQDLGGSVWIFEVGRQIPWGEIVPSFEEFIGGTLEEHFAFVDEVVARKKAAGA